VDIDLGQPPAGERSPSSSINSVEPSANGCTRYRSERSLRTEQDRREE